MNKIAKREIEYPMLMGGALIRAVLAKRKTVTRRLDLRWYRVRKGEYIWLRETFWQAHSYPGTDQCGEPSPLKESASNLIAYAADGDPKNTPNRHYPKGLRGGAIAAPDPYAVWIKKPSIHLPRRFCRILVKVTENPRREQLQEITAEEAVAEGLYQWSDPPRVPQTHYGLSRADVWETDPRKAFARIWDSVTPKGKPKWADDPRVVRLAFKIEEVAA